MKTNINISNALTLLSEMESSSAKFQILEYDDLQGSSDLSSAFMLSYMRSANIKLRQVKISLHDSSVFVESGALSFMRGNLDASSNVGGPGGLVKKFISSTLTGEHVIKPLFSGTGEVLLEPSFNHYVLLSLEEGEEVIVDDRMFFAAEGTVTLGAKAIRSISGAVLGRETLFQTSLKGPGIAVLEVPVPEQEIFKYKLNNDTLKVDGNIAFLRSGTIDFTVERSTSTLVGTAVAGEGFLHVYRGTGEVWLMQTKQVYDQIRELDNPFFRRRETEGMLETQDKN
ncbi:AIM24 family protein [Proteiniclasticum sp. QWL-01]|uniref:AIM24 family protein n=1 Tax=Proteiniclasticum sp. QWL-01 TaxID=3036945 RepID=UPI002205A146|nr:AIM24 family protein [Proteiniclasticum sp. QWL-01]UUM11874.1 AIM24 family protein [Clostridiaceae bacterium HFYG-1003]WFF73364.1 AIM24 family protein [Proteiniclasticum sp. QWL-01]